MDQLNCQMGTVVMQQIQMSYYAGNPYQQLGQLINTQTVTYGDTVYFPMVYQYEQQVVFNVGSYYETEEQRSARVAKEDAATKRAEELLMMHLTEKQIQQYLKDGYFETAVNDRLYRIRKGRAMNVELIESGVAKFRYCALPRDYTPAEDVMLAQLLMLEADEAKFLSTANRMVL